MFWCRQDIFEAIVRKFYRLFHYAMACNNPLPILKENLIKLLMFIVERISRGAKNISTTFCCFECLKNSLRASAYFFDQRSTRRNHQKFLKVVWKPSMDNLDLDPSCECCKNWIKTDERVGKWMILWYLAKDFKLAIHAVKDVQQSPSSKLLCLQSRSTF